MTAKDMKDKVESIDNLLQQKLQTKLEGRCSRHGFVLPGTLKILSRSMGHLEKGRFTGAILFHVQAEGSVLNPPDGIIVEGEVIRKNKMGMYVSYQDAIRIIVPRDLHIGDESFEAVEVGDVVQVEVKKSRFQINDPFILSVGVFVKSVKKGARRANATAVAAATAVPEPLPQVPAANAAPVEEAAEELDDEEAATEAGAEEDTDEQAVSE